jgi:hypothetical protein
VQVGLAKALRLALLLGKRFDHADAGNGVGEHVGHFRPDAVDFLEAGAQTVAHVVDQPADEGQRHQRDERKPRVDRKQDRRGHDDHEHVGDEVERMERQKYVDAIRLGAYARHQIARALAAEIIERQAQQVLVRRGAQVGAYALGHQCEDVGARPTQPPGEHRRQQQAAQVQQHQRRVDRLAVLERNQDVVHQRNRQVRRHQRGRRRGQCEQKPRNELALIGPRKPPQAQQHPGRGLRRLGAGAGRAFFAVGRQWRMADGAYGCLRYFVRGATCRLLLEALQQA